MTLDEVCGGSETRQMGVPQVDPETGMSGGCLNALNSYLDIGVDKGFDAMVERIKCEPILSYRAYFEKQEKKTSEAVGMPARYKNLVNEKNEGLVGLYDSAVKRINSLARSYDSKDQNSKSKIKTFFEIASNAICGEVPAALKEVLKEL